MTAPRPRPPFSALPLDPNGPAGNAWGLYGPNDSLGALNLLTPDVVAAAARSEIRSGERVSLDWHLNKPSHPCWDRPPFEHRRIVNTDQEGDERFCNDDFLTFNTQCSSQWDGFRHYGYQKAGKFYDGHAMEELDDPKVLGIDAWAENGGIVGRGVLLDYVGYCKKHDITPIDAMSASSVPVSTLKAIAREQDISFKSGDILLIRFGFTATYDALTSAQQEALPTRPLPEFLGVEPTADTLHWLWETEFAAVVGDAPSFEQAPVAGAHTRPGQLWAGEAWEKEMQGGGLLHQWLLAGWGCPIGEMFDLEALSEKCRALGRWTFFVSSVPLKVPGGVASPPNAIAIF